MNPFNGNENSADIFVAEVFSKNVPEVASAISEISNILCIQNKTFWSEICLLSNFPPTATHYQQEISRNIEDLTKLIVESAHSSTINPLQKMSNDELEKYKAITKIQNSVLFMTNLIHKSEWNTLSDV